jgi:peptidyl-prolyl cis-trans isomerase SurA
MRRLFCRAGIILLFLCGLASRAESVVDRVVAIVNQEAITLSEVEKWEKPLLKDTVAEDRLERQKKIRDFRRKVLENLIEERLIDQEVKRSGIKVSSRDVDAALEEIRRRNGSSQE